MVRPHSSNDYGYRSERLQRFAGQIGSLVGTRAPMSAHGEATAVSDRHAFPSWNLEPAAFITNDPAGYTQAQQVPLDHIRVVSPLDRGFTADGTIVSVRSRPNAILEPPAFPVENLIAHAPPAVGATVRYPAVIELRTGRDVKYSPNAFPARFNDELVTDAINAAFSGGPNKAVRRTVENINTRYEQLATEQRLVYAANDAIARQLIQRAGDVPLSSANADILRAAQQILGTLPTALPNPYNI